jgi:tetratricopeptide (TPR) repeat protein
MRIGHYEIVSVLGEGGMGIVYGARSPDGREVAVKVMRVVPDPASVAAFEREKRLLWSFGLADGFVPVLDAGSDSGRPYLVMPLLTGGTLRDRILAMAPFSVAESIALVRRLAASIGRAHDRGVVHRDLKPGNVIFTADGKALVADLGFAKHYRRDLVGASESLSLSASGGAAGTPGYMAPEQLEDAKSVGPAADVFALGVMLHECLTGKRPWEATGVVAYARALEEPPVPLRAQAPGTPAWLEAVVSRALAREPARRFADGRALDRALEAGARRRGSGRIVVGAAGLAVVALAALAAFGAASGAPRPGASLPGAGEYCRLAEEALARGEGARAIAAFTSAIGVDPVRSAAWSGRARARGIAGDNDGALADSTRAIELDAKNARAFGIRGASRALRGEREAAIADLTAAIELDPKTARPWTNRSLLRQQAGDLDGALADADRGIELDPTDPEGWASRSDIRGVKGDRDGALADAKRRVELDPKEPRAWCDLGAAREALADHDGAIGDETRAIELDPACAIAYANRSAARSKKDDRRGAILDLERFLELAPDHPYAARARTVLETLRR